VGKNDDEMERAFSVEEPARLSVRGHAGDVHIRAWDDAVIRVRAEGDEPAFSASSNSVEVQSGHGTADYEIRVPRRCAVEVNSDGGEVTLEGTTGDVTIHTQSGEVTLLSIRGNCSVRTVSGELSVEDIAGRLAFNTASGDLTVERSALSSFDLESASGDAEVETSLARDGGYRFQTASGDLVLRIPRGAGASIVLQTHSGDIECDLPAHITHASRGRWEGTINGGGARIEMQSQSGDLEIEESDELPAFQFYEERETVLVPETQFIDGAAHGDGVAREASESSDSSRVLELLARGEIGVDEAMAELDRIGQ
jgi:DUF4097 and DUF4098 domain-containing protein YvlB